MAFITSCLLGVNYDLIVEKFLGLRGRYVRPYLNYPKQPESHHATALKIFMCASNAVSVLIFESSVLLNEYSFQVV